MTPARTPSRFRRFAAMLLGRDTPEAVARDAAFAAALGRLDAEVAAGTLTQAQAEEALARLAFPRENGTHAEGPASR